MRHMPPIQNSTGSYWPMLIHGIVNLVIFALIVALVIVLIKKYRKGTLHVPTFAGTHAPSVDNDPYLSALKLLNERLAKGEVDVDEYYARRTALKGPDPAPPTEG